MSKRSTKSELYDGMSYKEFVEANKHNTELDMVLVESLQEEFEDENGEKHLTPCKQGETYTFADNAVVYYKGVKYSGKYERRVETSETGRLTVSVKVNDVKLK